MKYLIFILSLVILWLAWCSQNNKQYKLPTISLYNDSWTNNIWTIQNHIPLTSWTWNILWWILLSWSDYKIIISWNTLTYNWIFRFNFPQGLLFWDYNFSMINTLFLFGNSYVTSLSVFYSQKPILETHKLCVAPERLWAWYTWFSSKKIFLQTIPIYIINALYETWTPEKWKQSRPIQEICFWINNMMYIISLSNYDKIQFQNIIDSFTFLN
jgi:hypothetical protein